MSTLSITGTGLGSQLTDLMNADTIEPGSDPSYQICKTIYLYHPLGGKMVDGPVKLAQSQPRTISIPNGPEEKVREAFLSEWGRLKCDQRPHLRYRIHHFRCTESSDRHPD
jgi:hypothetical protein